MAVKALDADTIDRAGGTTKAALLASTGAALIGVKQPDLTAIARTLDTKVLEVVSAKDFSGVVGDGVNNDAAGLLKAINACVATGRALHIPAGIYMIGDMTGLVNHRIEPTLTNGSSLVIFGDGPGVTIIKEKPGDTATYGSFHMMLYLNVGAGVTMEQIVVRDLTLDKNGASNGTPAGSFDWQQSHCLSLAINATGLVKRVRIENVFTKDKVGGGIVFAGGPILTAIVRNCHGTDFSGQFGERGDLEFQATVERGSVENCTGRYVQLEPNVSTPAGGITTARMQYINCQYRVFDLYGYSAALQSQEFLLFNCQTPADGDFWFQSCKVAVDRCSFRSNGSVDWRNVIGEIANTTITIGVNTTTNVFNSLQIGTTSLVKTDLRFRRTSFIPDSTVTGATTGVVAWAGSSGVVASADIAKFKVRFEECTFDPAFEKTADCYRNGQWEFVRCALTARTGQWAIQAGATSTQRGDVLVQDCDLTNVIGGLIRIAASSSLWALTFRGQLDYAKCVFLNRPTSEWEGYVNNEATWLADARPAAGGYLGQKVHLRKPTSGQAGQFICITSSITTATYRMTAQAGPAKNTTANRPAPNANDIGLLFMDTTLDADGKPIWWQGTKWIDATGADA